MFKVVLSQIKANFSRILAIGIAIFLATLFLVVTLNASPTLSATLASSLGINYKNADLVVSNPSGDSSSDSSDAQSAQTPPKKQTLTSSTVKNIKDVEGVDNAFAVKNTQSVLSKYSSGSSNADSDQALLQSITTGSLNPYELTEGNFPVKENEVAIAASAEGFKLNDTISLAIPPTNPQQPAEKKDVKIVGKIDTSGILNTGSSVNVFVPEKLIDQFPQVNTREILVSVTHGKNAETVLKNLKNTPSLKGLDISTSEQKMADDLKSFSSNSTILTAFFLLFAVIAIFVAILVISNTFSVLIAQRTRQLALLRCLGATKSQVKQSVFSEAFLVGLLSSVVGTAAGVGTVFLAVTLAKNWIPYATFALNPWSIFWGILTGTIITLIAAAVPARNATAVWPLAALRNNQSPTVSKKKRKTIIIVGAILMILGIVFLAFAFMVDDTTAGLGLGLLGGILSFIGILCLARIIVAPSINALGSLFKGFSVPANLARLNAVRNPGRTATSTASLLVGVTLVLLIATGAEGVKNYTETTLSESYPVDTQIAGRTGSQEVFTKKMANEVKNIEHVKDSHLIKPAGYVIDSSDRSSSHNSNNGSDTSNEIKNVVYGLNPDVAQELTGISDMKYGPDQLLVNNSYPAKNGDQITVKGQKSSKKLTVVKSQSEAIRSLITEQTAKELGELAPETKLTNRQEREVSGGRPLYTIDMDNPTLPQIWINYDENAKSEDIGQAQKQILNTLQIQDGQIMSIESAKNLISSVINIILNIIIGLLAVAVIIALVGMANTLSLSILERTRENSLLRALGLTKKQLRAMLIIESVLITMVGALLGIILGVVYGNLAVKIVFPTSHGVYFPWMIILGTIIIALLAGILSSLLPARKALTLSPVKGLANTD